MEEHVEIQNDEDEKQINGQSFFSMEYINKIASEPDLDKAKEMAINVVEDSSARKSNVVKTTELIHNKKNRNDLIIMMGNFFLAHPGEGLGVIR